MRLGAVLFDLDGTLAHSEPHIVAAVTETLARHGFDVDLTRDGPLIGPPMTEVLRRITGAPDSRVHALFEEYREHYLANHAPATQPLPGAVALLDALRAASVPLGIITNKHEVAARALLGYLGWSGRFSVVVGADQAPRPKPAPEHAIEALRLLGVSPTEAVLVGDDPVDMACGRAARLARVVGVANTSTVATLIEAGATDVCASLAEVAALLVLLVPRAVSEAAG